MTKKTKEKLIEAVETIAKPVTLPISFVADRLNELMKKLEAQTARKEIVSTVDGFVDTLIEEAKDAEKGLFAFFSEMLFAHNLAERIAGLENELTLVDILGRRTVQFLKPDLVVGYTRAQNQQLLPVFRYPSETIGEDRLMELKPIAEEDFVRGDEFMREKVKIGQELYTLVSLPLRSTSERFGLLILGRAGGKTFRSDEISLAVAGAAVVGFMLSNIRLHQQILRDKQLVAIGKTLAGVSHDMRNILTNLEGGLELLARSQKEKDDKMFAQAYSIVSRSYERLKTLVLAMVDYSRQRELNLQPTDLNALIEEVAASFASRLKEKGVKLKRSLDRHLPVMLLDSVGVERLVANLVDNAIDAVEKDKGLISLRTKYFSESKTVCLWVKDNGCGIRPELQEKIFDLFYSAKGSRGTGFGLAIVQKVAREHGGTVEVFSQPGQGATFLVKLPVRVSGNTG
ncbi:MAG: ATP-binding protein [Candidatus Omnitrophica bacterium]|nr:ATP-binding protein [Candidatus Omnitrophota bacterium]